jgi:hypothetical protein
VLQINTVPGINGVLVEENSFVTSAETQENGVLVVKGEDPGKYPSRDFYLFTIHWIAQKMEKTKIDITVVSFLNVFKEEIGIYRGGSYNIEIK